MEPLNTKEPRDNFITIISIEPTSVHLHSICQITVNGSHFEDGVFVLADNIILGTAFVSSTQVRCTVAGEVTSSSGNKNLMVQDPQTGVLSNSFPLFVMGDK